MRSQGTGSVFRRKQDGLWVAQLSLPPRPTQKRPRKSEVHPTKKKAEEALLRMQIDLRNRGDLPTDSQTVQQFLTYWLNELAVKEVKPNTWLGYRTVINNYINPTIGSTRLTKTTAAMVRRVTDAMLEAGKSSTYALLARRVMSTAFTVAEAEGRINKNPAKIGPAPRKAVPALEALTADEAIRLLLAVADDPNGPLWATYLLTGARRGEIIGLEWNRVTTIIDLSWQMQRLETGARGTRGQVGKPIAPADYEHRHVSGGLYLTRPKTGRGKRVVPITDVEGDIGPLPGILRRHQMISPPNEWGLVFTDNGRPWDPDRVTRAWNKVLEKVGIDKRVRLHDVRHTTVDLLYEAQVPEAIIQEIVGHSTRSTTRGYRSKGNMGELSKGMRAFTALLTQPAAPPQPLPDDAVPPSTALASHRSTPQEPPG